MAEAADAPAPVVQGGPGAVRFPTLAEAEVAQGGGASAARTVPDVVHHYTTQDAVPGIRAQGLWSHSSATDVGTYTAQQAVERLGVKTPPDVVIDFKNNGQFISNRPAIVQPHPLGPGGGLDLTNPRLVSPQCILCIRPVK